MLRYAAGMPTTILATVDPLRSRVDARTDAGHRVEMDTVAPEGDDGAASPKETLLAALAACTAMDVASILRKKRQRATRYEVAVSAESAAEHPRVFTSITVEHRLAGDVEPEAARRSVELSATRYCPVNAMIAGSVPVEHWYRLTERGDDEAAVLVAVTGPQGTRVL